MQMMSTIRIYLMDDVVIYMFSETFLMTMWTKLEKMYMMKLLTNTLFFWKQFYQLQMSEEQSMREHLSNFQKILTDLLSVGEKIEEKIEVLVLLSSLFSYFEYLVIALLIEKSSIKMDGVMFALLQNEVLRQENRASSSSNDSDLVVTGVGGGRG